MLPSQGTRPVSRRFLRARDTAQVSEKIVNGEARFLMAGLLLRVGQSLLRRKLLRAADGSHGLSVVTTFEGQELGRGAVERSSLTRVQANPNATG